MGTPEETLKEFLKSKYSGNTQKYVNYIVDVLNVPDETGAPALVRAKVLQDALVPGKIPYSGLYYRLLKEMVETGIITKEIGEREPGKKGKKPTFYRLKSNNLLFLHDTLSSLHKEREDLLTQPPAALVEIIEELTREKLELELRLDIAIKLLQEAGINPEEIEKRIREMEE
jgi:hypothetical protein